jgi:hypothetical protein
MATLTYVLAEDVEADDMIDINEFAVEVVESDILVEPFGAVRVLNDAEDVDKFNVRITTMEGYLIVPRSTEFPLEV